MYQILRLKKNKNRLENSVNWSRFIVLKSKKGLVPLTKLSSFIIEKCIKKILQHEDELTANEILFNSLFV